jgi:curved DNA-binding protein CbpA
VPTYYQILELPEQASPDDIRRAYLRLVRVTHPDRTPDPAAHRRYLLVNEAYDTLRQPALRARYDAQLTAARQPPRPAAPTYTQPFGGNAYQVLRVPYSATPAQIEQAYQRLRQRLGTGPADPGLRAYLAQVEHAYATLSSPLLRPAHDARVRGQRPRQAVDPYAQAYARLAPYARPVCRALAALFLLILLDRNLTLSFPNEQAQTVQYDPGSRNLYWVETPNATFRVENAEEGDRFDVERSAIFRKVRSYQRRPAGGGRGEVIDYSPNTIYGFAFLLPLAMGVCAGAGAWPGSTARRTVDCAIVSAMLSLIVVYLLTVL